MCFDACEHCSHRVLAGEEQFVANEARLARIERHLRGLANVDDDAEVRAFAAKLMQLMFPE